MSVSRLFWSSTKPKPPILCTVKYSEKNNLDRDRESERKRKKERKKESVCEREIYSNCAEKWK